MQETVIAPATARLVWEAAQPVVQAEGVTLPPDAVAARVRPALEQLAWRTDVAEIGWDLQLGARAALAAACGVEQHEPQAYARLQGSLRHMVELASRPRAAPEAIDLVSVATAPVIEALDAPSAPRTIAARCRPALEKLAWHDAIAGLGWDTRLAARDAASAACGVERGEPRSYGRFLRAIRRLLQIADLPVPVELVE